MIGFWNYTVYLTYLSIISGSAGICFAASGKPWGIWVAIGCLLLSGLCDLFDGSVARTKKDRTEQEKSFGIQIDSLSDLVSFGVLPAVIGFAMISANYHVNEYRFWFIPVFVLVVLFGLIRLAYFNVLAEDSSNEGGKKFYWGMPITMTSLLVPFVFAIEVAIEKLAKVQEFSLSYIMLGALLLMAILFVLKIKVPKMHKKGIIALSVIGLSLFVACIVIYNVL